MENWTEMSRNMLRISRGDTSLFEQVTSDFVKNLKRPDVVAPTKRGRASVAVRRTENRERVSNFSR